MLFFQLHLTIEAKKRSLVITFQNLVGTLLAMFFSLCYRQLNFINQMERESGYYWVKRSDGEWSVAFWNNYLGVWQQFEWTYSDSDYAEIDEKRLRH